MTNTLQPLLSKDKKNPYLSIYKSKKDPKKIEVYFELALIEKINDRLDSYHGKHLLARLYNANFKRKNLVETFGYAVSTLRRWGNALLIGNPEIIHHAFSGQGAPKKITPEIERFVISKFNEIYQHNTYDYSQKILDGVQEIFNKSLSSEAIRPIIKEERRKFLLSKNQRQQKQSTPPKTEDKLNEGKTKSLQNEANTSESTKNQSEKSLSSENQKLVQKKLDGMKSNVSLPVDERGEKEGDKSKTCDLQRSLTSNSKDNRKHSLSKLDGEEIRIHHIGLVLVFFLINELDFDEKIVYQWLVSVLAGSVNIEQTASLDFKSLQYLLDQQCITSKR